MSAALLALLDAYAAGDDPWMPGYADRKATATARLLAAVRDLATHQVAAFRLLSALHAERLYAETNAAAGDRMHRTTPDYGPIIHAERARLTADRDGIPPGADTAWCPTCRTRRAVEDVDPHASTYVGDREVEWTQTALACGHTLTGPERTVGRAPGGEAAAEATADRATRDRLARAASWQDA